MRVQEAAEIVALGLFNQGSAAGQTVTMSMVTRRIEQLLAHRSGCCGRCEFAAKARAEHVFRIVGGGSGDTGRRPPSAEHSNDGRIVTAVT